MEFLAPPRAAGKLDKIDAAAKRDVITFEFEDLGATYAENVNKRFADAVAARKAADAALAKENAAKAAAKFDPALEAAARAWVILPWPAMEPDVSMTTDR